MGTILFILGLVYCDIEAFLFTLISLTKSTDSQYISIRFTKCMVGQSQSKLNWIIGF